MTLLRSPAPPSLPPSPFPRGSLALKTHRRKCPGLLAAAEIKHGRVAMLAVVGFIMTQYIHLPGDQFQVGPLEAVTSLPIGIQAQVLSCECPGSRNGGAGGGVGGLQRARDGV